MYGILDPKEHRKDDLVMFCSLSVLVVSFLFGAMGLLAESSLVSSTLLLVAFTLAAIGSAALGYGLLSHNKLIRREIDSLMRAIQIRTKEPWER